jgi:hypothetical protein
VVRSDVPVQIVPLRKRVAATAATLRGDHHP